MSRGRGPRLARHRHPIACAPCGGEKEDLDGIYHFEANELWDKMQEYYKVKMREKNRIYKARNKAERRASALASVEEREMKEEREEEKERKEMEQKEMERKEMETLAEEDMDGEDLEAV